LRLLQRQLQKLVEHARREYLCLAMRLAAEIVRHAGRLGTLPVDTASQNAHQPPGPELPPGRPATKLDLYNRITILLLDTSHSLFPLASSLMLKRPSPVRLPPLGNMNITAQKEKGTKKNNFSTFCGRPYRL
jgi:hypothetical protein